MTRKKANITPVFTKEGRNPTVFCDKKTGTVNKGRA